MTLRATVTDNIVVTAVNIVFRNASTATWLTRAMAKTDTNRYSITMSGTDIGNQYLEYYIEAKDSANTALSGSAESPYKVYVSLPSDTDTDGDGVNNAEDAFPYDPNENNDLDGDGEPNTLDTDDDGDGVLDGDDAFPTDGGEWMDTDAEMQVKTSTMITMVLPIRAIYSILIWADSDGDGLPNKWETENGLNPNDAADSDSDSDFDGYYCLGGVYSAYLADRV